MTDWHAELVHLCLYPFLSAASKYVEESGITLDNLIRTGAFRYARSRGKERIIEAINAGKVRKQVIISNAQAETELLSYPFARILVSCIGDEHLVRRYALSEAKAAYEKLLEDSSTGSSSDTDIIYEMSEEFGIRVDFLPGEREQVQMPFGDYLRFTANLRDKRWKLVNRGLEKGEVKLRKSEFVRIIQEAMYERIKKDLPLDVPADICEAISGYTGDIKKELEEKRKKFGDAGFGFDFESGSGFLVKDPSCFPPCISYILSNLKEGINVPHSARFAVTAFLLNVGLTEDEIIEIYKNSPDFDEDRTRYQVGHIAGDKGSVRYTAPSCATMRTYGNCIGNDEVCEKIPHPLSYYKLKLKMKMKKEQQGKSSQKEKDEKIL
jgi:DNA primase large subunit